MRRGKKFPYCYASLRRECDEWGTPFSAHDRHTSSWRKTFTAKGPRSGSPTKNSPGYPVKSRRSLETQTIPSSLSSSMTAARYPPLHCFRYWRPQCLNLTDLIFSLTSLQEVTINTSVKEIKDGREDLPPLRNPPLLETADDLATLSHLNEPSGMYNKHS